MTISSGKRWLKPLVVKVVVWRDCTLEASILKAACNENYKFISERAVQIHGGIGTSREYDIALFYRKAKSCKYSCGDTEYHQNRIMDRCVDQMQAY